MREKLCLGSISLKRSDWPNTKLDADTRLMLRAGDRVQTIKKIYLKYQPVVRDYIASHNGRLGPVSVDDMTQEVFVRLWQKQKQFKGRSSIKTYIFAIARNILLEQRFRSAKEKIKHSNWLKEKSLIPPSNASSVPLAETSRIEIIQLMKQARQQLTPRQNLALKLRYVEGLSLQEAAQRSNCSVTAFSGRLLRARRLLRRQLTPLAPPFSKPIT